MILTTSIEKEREKKKRKSKRVPENIYFCFIDYSKAFDCVDHNELWKILKEMGIPDHLTASSEIFMQVKKQQLEPDMEKRTGSKLGKEYVKAVYYHLALLTGMQSSVQFSSVQWLSRAQLLVTP